MTLESSRIYVILCKADQHVVVSVILCFLISKTALIIRKQNKEKIVASRWVIILTLSSRNNHFTQIKNRYFHASILNLTVQPRLCKRNQGSDAINTTEIRFPARGAAYIEQTEALLPRKKFEFIYILYFKFS